MLSPPQDCLGTAGSKRTQKRETKQKDFHTVELSFLRPDWEHFWNCLCPKTHFPGFQCVEFRQGEKLRLITDPVVVFTNPSGGVRALTRCSMQSQLCPAQEPRWQVLTPSYLEAAWQVLFTYKREMKYSDFLYIIINYNCSTRGVFPIFF